ncbi:hypothetical protein [Coralliovum pocilloporae]|uniref:hypothetical protein n=1 Tax=Coralliovum pocilloporae TaxID=3066369 RepID=UPI0033078BB6
MFCVATACVIAGLQPTGAVAKKVTTETIRVVPADGESQDANPTPLKPTGTVDQVVPKNTAPDTGTGPSENVISTPQVQTDLSRLPEPVRSTRDAILEAARSGDIEKLRPVLEANEVPPTLSFGGYTDPIDFLKESSGDPEGHELLAILIEILEIGYVHLDPGQPQEMYVWPYFFSVPLDDLTPPQRVDLFKVVTYGDYEDMKQFGAYIFYRVGIGPDGTWHFFVAGD